MSNYLRSSCSICKSNAAHISNATLIVVIKSNKRGKYIIEVNIYLLSRYRFTWSLAKKESPPTLFCLGKKWKYLKNNDLEPEIGFESRLQVGKVLVPYSSIINGCLSKVIPS
jgi:hypothetical protein